MHLNASRLSRALHQPTTHPSNMHLNKRGHTDLNLHPFCIPRSLQLCSGCQEKATIQPPFHAQGSDDEAPRTRPGGYAGHVIYQSVCMMNFVQSNSPYDPPF